ncbi:MAG: hypothetical protein IK013_06670 [Bacteroidales bacterium]|nr:hypothetical protein [Bacteroidales bacterium]
MVRKCNSTSCSCSLIARTTGVVNTISPMELRRMTRIFIFDGGCFSSIVEIVMIYC